MLAALDAVTFALGAIAILLVIAAAALALMELRADLFLRALLAMVATWGVAP